MLRVSKKSVLGSQQIFPASRSPKRSVRGDENRSPNRIKQALWGMAKSEAFSPRAEAPALLIGY